MPPIPTLAFLAALLIGTLALPARSLADGPTGAAVINGQKVLTLISRNPPGVRCNNNIQVAAERSNLYKIPVQIIPVTFAGAGARAPAVYYGRELIAIDGGATNGMVSFTQLSDVFEVEGVTRQAQQGRLMEIKKDFDALNAAIKDVK